MTPRSPLSPPPRSALGWPGSREESKGECGIVVGEGKGRMVGRRQVWAEIAFEGGEGVGRWMGEVVEGGGRESGRKRLLVLVVSSNGLVEPCMKGHYVRQGRMNSMRCSVRWGKGK